MLPSILSFNAPPFFAKRNPKVHTFNALPKQSETPTIEIPHKDKSDSVPRDHSSQEPPRNKATFLPKPTPSDSLSMSAGGGCAVSNLHSPFEAGWTKHFPVRIRSYRGITSTVTETLPQDQESPRGAPKNKSPGNKMYSSFEFDWASELMEAESGTVFTRCFFPFHGSIEYITKSPESALQ